MNQFGRFKLFHAITLLCALMFLGIKSFEYHDKFTHYEIALKDGKFADGHMVENRLKLEGTAYTGYAIIRGHIVDGRGRNCTICTPTEAPAHEEIRIEGAQISRS